jgi:hypothetical protein
MAEFLPLTKHGANRKKTLLGVCGKNAWHYLRQNLSYVKLTFIVSLIWLVLNVGKLCTLNKNFYSNCPFSHLNYENEKWKQTNDVMLACIA